MRHAPDGVIFGKNNIAMLACDSGAVGRRVALCICEESKHLPDQFVAAVDTRFSIPLVLSRA